MPAPEQVPVPPLLVGGVGGVCLRVYSLGLGRVADRHRIGGLDQAWDSPPMVALHRLRSLPKLLSSLQTYLQSYCNGTFPPRLLAAGQSFLPTW